MGKELFLRVIVQSNSRDAHYLDERIESFLVQYRETLAAMTAEELQTNITACVDQLREKPKNLDVEAARLWEEVESGLYLFTRKAQKAEYLLGGADGAGLGLGEVLEFFDTYLNANSARRTKFCSEFYGDGRKYPARSTPHPAGTVVVNDPAAFKRSMDLKAILSVDLDMV